MLVTRIKLTWRRRGGARKAPWRLKKHPRGLVGGHSGIRGGEENETQEMRRFAKVSSRDANRSLAA